MPATSDEESSQGSGQARVEGSALFRAAKTEPVVDLEPKDQLLYQWGERRLNSAALASHPNRFYQLIQTAKPV
jgi:hypothetical protein